jgi:hypothetical protein
MEALSLWWEVWNPYQSPEPQVHIYADGSKYEQRRWLELIKDCHILYNPGKTNVVADVLSRKSREEETDPVVVIEELAQQFAIAWTEDVLTNKTPVLAALVVKLLAPNKIRQAQENDLELRDLLRETTWGEATSFHFSPNRVLKTEDGRIVVPNNAELRREILDEAHQTQYTVHPGNKMYQDLKKKFLWCCMKWCIAEYVAQCPSCQLVKAEHQRPAGQLQPLEVTM